MNPNLNAVLAQLRVVLIVIGTLMAEQGYDHTTAYKWIIVASGAVMVLGNALWALWASISNWWKAAAVGTQSGINLVLSGKALAADGKTLVSQIGPDTTPALQVTIASTKEIAKDFPPAAPIAKS